MEDIAVVHTCGVCEMIIDQNNIPTYVCMEGYTRFFIDENFYFYPVTDDNKIIRRSLVSNEEIVLPVRKNIPGTIKILSPVNRETQGENENRSFNKKEANRRSKCTVNYDDEELLILSVQERRPLWDFTVPLEQQSQRLTKKLWDEVNLAEKPKKNLKTYMTPTDE
ncbi:uncharacterized protein [Anoplolepis gracilipes]|uniref:uncharacterized protein n=1 Tax=Anoplolepis gracilipes TaxID=354296 RepID=UPI003B9E7C06